jgi:hypothetical protein
MFPREHEGAPVEVKKLGILQIGCCGNLLFRQLGTQIIVDPLLRIDIQGGAPGLKLRARIHGGRRCVRARRRGRLAKGRLILLKIHTAIKAGGGRADKQQKDQETHKASLPSFLVLLR